MRRIKLLTILTVILMTAYPVGELTRCIIQYMIIEGMGEVPVDIYYVELMLIWGLYLAMFWLLNKFIDYIWLKGLSGED